MMDRNQVHSDVQIIKEWETVPMGPTIVQAGWRVHLTPFQIVIALTSLAVKCITILLVQAQ